MAWKFDVIFRHDYSESFLWLLNLDKLQDLQVIVVYLICQWIRTNINHINIGVLDAEYSCYLHILFLLEFLNRHSLNF